MKKRSRVIITLLVLLVVLGAFSAFGQTPQFLKRTTFKTDKFDFGVGGTVEIAGAPVGSINVEGTQKNEIEISAEVEVQAANEADLAKLAELTGFSLNESVGRAAITTIGLNNKKTLPKALKKIPKELIGLPYKINYVIKVPHYCDLIINGGKGDLTVTGVEGSIKINYLDTNARISLIGGGVNATFGSGTIDVTMPNRSWRGNAIDIALSSGAMSVHVPWNLSAELDASILKTGSIENGLTELKPRDRKVPISDKIVAAKAGNGGVSMKFTVGDGTLKLKPFSKP